jgi:FMN reductase
MSRQFRITALVGSTSTKSRTQVLVDAIVKALSTQVAVDVSLVELSKLGTHFGAATLKDQLDPQAASALDKIEQADLVIAASPVYKGSYTGLFKHVIDFVGIDALVDTPVILAATGGGDRHALVVEHQLRPLFGFFRAHTIPTAVYASEAELANYEVISLALQERINEAAAQAAQVLRHTVSTDALLKRAA